MMGFDVGGFDAFHLVWVQIKACLGATLVTKSTASALVLGNQPIELLFFRVAPSASFMGESTLASQKGKTHFFALSPFFMPIDAIFAGAADAVLASSHYSRFWCLKSDAVIVVEVGLSTRHDMIRKWELIGFQRTEL